MIEHIYVHVPFCLSKCGYCSFYSVPLRESSQEQEKYRSYILRELASYNSITRVKAKTIYFGGGTPSLLNPQIVRSILEEIPQDIDCEITLETNPGDITHSKVSDWQQAGINRISTGWQSMLDSELNWLGRRHSASENIKALKVLRDCGITNISLDLIYGLPGQSINDIKYSVERYLKAEPEHISTYCLSLDKSCVLARQAARLPSDDLAAQMYYFILDYLGSSSLRQYELSNFALPGKHSRHNLAYWQNKYYLGLGAAASGYLPGVRYSNPADIEQWCNNIDEARILPGRDIIDTELHRKEEIILALRTCQGLEIKKYNKKFRVDFKADYADLLARLIPQNLLEYKDGFVRLTPRAYFISNEIFSEFI